jgi:hypothetical protein
MAYVETRFLQFSIVVDDIETDDRAASRQQPLRNVEADKAGGSGQYRVIRHFLSEGALSAATALRLRAVICGRVSS